MNARFYDAHAATEHRLLRRPRYSVSRHVLPGLVAAILVLGSSSAHAETDAAALLAPASQSAAASAPPEASADEAATWLAEARSDAPVPASPARMGGILFLGAGLVAAAGYVLQRRRKLGVGGQAPIRHLQSVRLGARQQVTLVEIDGRRLLLGVSDKDIRLLGDLAASVEESAHLELQDVLAAVDDSVAAPRRSTSPRVEPSIDLHAGERVELSAAARSSFRDPLDERTEDAAPASDAPEWDAAFAEALEAAEPITELEPVFEDAPKPDRVTLSGGRPSPTKRDDGEPTYPPPRRFARVVAAPDQPHGEPALERAADAWTPSRRTSLLAGLAPEEQRSLRAGGDPVVDPSRSSERAGVMAGLASLRSRSMGR